MSDDDTTEKMIRKMVGHMEWLPASYVRHLISVLDKLRKDIEQMKATMSEAWVLDKEESEAFEAMLREPPEMNPLMESALAEAKKIPVVREPPVNKDNEDHLTRILKEEDPIRLVAVGAPHDEYGVEAGLILDYLGKSALSGLSTHEGRMRTTHNVVYGVFVLMFGWDMIPVPTDPVWGTISKRLLSEIKDFNPPS